MQVHREQLRAIYAMLKELGVNFGTRAERMCWLNGYRFALGLNVIDSFNDMTAQEASVLQRALHDAVKKHGK